MYDLTDYFNTISIYSTSSGEGVPNYAFLDSDVTDLIKQQPGQDLTSDINKIFEAMSAEDVQQQMTCLDNAFRRGTIDFRSEPKCTVQNWLLLAFSIIMMSTVVAKCELRGCQREKTRCLRLVLNSLGCASA